MEAVLLSVIQLRGDLAVGKALGYQGRHLPLAATESSGGSLGVDRSDPDGEGVVPSSSERAYSTACFRVIPCPRRMPPPRSPGPSASGWSRVEARTTCALRDTRTDRWRPGILRPRPRAERLARRPSAPAATARHSKPSAVSRSISSSAVLARGFCQQPLSPARGAGG